MRGRRWLSFCNYGRRQELTVSGHCKHVIKRPMVAGTPEPPTLIQQLLSLCKWNETLNNCMGKVDLAALSPQHLEALAADASLRPMNRYWAAVTLPLEPYRLQQQCQWTLQHKDGDY